MARAFLALAALAASLQLAAADATAYGATYAELGGQGGACGGLGQACCQGEVCKGEGMACAPADAQTTRCIACGDEGLPACAGAQERPRGLRRRVPWAAVGVLAWSSGLLPRRRH